MNSPIDPPIDARSCRPRAVLVVEKEDYSNSARQGTSIENECRVVCGGCDVIASAVPWHITDDSISDG